MELKGAIQTYAWGKLGRNSKVATLFKRNDSSFEIDESRPYAELWMGTHCNGPSSLKSNGQILQEWILSNVNCLGREVIEKFGNELPFLFKVLSVEKALSIQAHPSKGHAEQLHKLQPEIYKDPNHKPELAIALTKFEALCGFRPISEIKDYLRGIAHLREVIGVECVADFLNNDNPEEEKILLKTCFQQLMKCSKIRIERSLHCLLSQIKSGTSLPLSTLLKTLHKQYPGDVGCFCIYFLNYVILDIGESIYLGPNIPHAYISGDCVECMACSDNVVRAGLTPKFRDVETLCDMLTYECMSAESVKFLPQAEDNNTKIFKPPVPDFAVALTKVSNGSSYITNPRNSASIILVVKGKGLSGNLNIEEGTIIFLPAEEKFEINCTEETIIIYQAYANV